MPNTWIDWNHSFLIKNNKEKVIVRLKKENIDKEYISDKVIAKFTIKIKSITSFDKVSSKDFIYIISLIIHDFLVAFHTKLYQKLC